MIDLSVPSTRPVEWRARVDGGCWIRWKDPIVYQFAQDARREAAWRLNVEPVSVEVQRVDQ